MKKIILHIGRHKSGTTTIQKFLYNNKKLLIKHGFYYPESGIRRFSHHQISETLSRQNIKKLGDNYKTIIDEHRLELDLEIGGLSEQIVISSEAFQNCEPQIVKEFFAGYDVSIVVYLRNQVGYLISSYAQKVHASDYAGTMVEFYDNIFNSEYYRFLNGWRMAFGDNISVRIFDRESLIKRDIVYDFSQMILGIPMEEVESSYVQTDANPTLTSRLVAYKLFLNHTCQVPERLKSRLYACLSELSKSDDSGKLVIQRTLADRVITDCHAPNAKTAREYFRRDVLFPEQKIDYGEPYELSDADVDTVTQQLVAMHPELVECITPRMAQVESK